VAEDACQAATQSFTLAKFCGSVTCVAQTGACCDRSPGAGGACTDDVLLADCGAPDSVWTFGAACADVDCQEVRGACCDGFTGTCTNGALLADCQGTNQVWNRDAVCSAITCDPVPGACCIYEGVGSGSVTVSCVDGLVQSQCQGENNVWTKGVTCDDVVCGDPDVFVIPTVSEWGLVVLALSLLIFAKVWYGYRPARRPS